MTGTRAGSAGASGRDHLFGQCAVDAERLASSAKPIARAVDAEGKQCFDPLGTTTFERLCGIAQERLRQQEPGVRADRRQIARFAGGQAADIGDAKLAHEPQQLVFDDIGQRADNQQLLIGLGVDELSVSARSIALVKARVRELDFSQSQLLARQALGLDSAAAVRALVEEIG